MPLKFTILDTMTILKGAWNRVSAEKLSNCFKKAGIDSEAQQLAVCDVDDLFSFLNEELESLRETPQELAPSCATLNDVICTDQQLLT